MKTEWIKTESKLPKFNEYVLVYCQIYGIYIGCYQQILGTKFGNWSDGNNLGILPPTHWMYLPESPI